MRDTYPNVTEFLKLMDMIDYKEFNKFLATVEEHDIGQYVHRLSEEAGNTENDIYPSDEAVEILRGLVKKYPRS